jgi:hypothetical protein
MDSPSHEDSKNIKKSNPGNYSYVETDPGIMERNKLLVVPLHRTLGC